MCVCSISYPVRKAHAPYCIVIYVLVGKKVKVTLLQALRLCTGRTAHRGSRGIAILFHDQRH